MENQLEKPFGAYLSHASKEAVKVQKIASELCERNKDIFFDNPFDPSKTTEEDMTHLSARTARTTLEMPKGHDMKITEQCLNKIIANEGFVRSFGLEDSSGSDIEGAYAILFGKQPLTICEIKKYANHPWVRFHSRNVFSSFGEFEKNFRRIVDEMRNEPNSADNVKIEMRTKWMRSILNLPAKKIGSKAKLYLAHATTHMDEVRDFQIECEKYLGEKAELVNPYFGELGSEEEKEIEAARKKGIEIPVSDDFEREIVHKDVDKGIIDSDGIVVILNDSYTIGREKELVYGMLAGKQVTLGVCFDKHLYNHPLIRAHLDRVVFYEDAADFKEIAKDVSEKILELIEEKKSEGLNERVEKFRKFIREKLNFSENGAARI